jgi:hypothetical protein
MGNKTSTIYPKLNNYDNTIFKKDVDVLFNELKNNLMSQFNEKDKGCKKKIDTIALYGDIREILIIDINDKKERIHILVNAYEVEYVLTNSQKKLINNICNCF